MVKVGRDIGSYVLKDAGVKIFLTASAEVRAGRRLKELREKEIGRLLLKRCFGISNSGMKMTARGRLRRWYVRKTRFCLTHRR